MENVDKILTQGMISGEGYVKTAKKLQDAMGRRCIRLKGLLLLSLLFTSQSQNDCFKDLGVKQFEFVATLDKDLQS